MLAPSGGRLYLHACSRGPEGGGGGLSTLSGAVLLEPSTLPVGDYFLYKSICSFVNVDSRPIRVRRARQVPQGRVPRGVHGEARL